MIVRLQKLPNLIDPNSTIEFGKLKLKNPQNMDTLSAQDYVCGFDTSTGELSKTKIKLSQVATAEDVNEAMHGWYRANSSGSDSFTTNPAYGYRAVKIEYNYSAGSLISVRSLNTLGSSVQNFYIDPNTAVFIFWCAR